ncbi:MAG: amino acid permease, partial [Luteitalea sp.]|nr:amino acid permease [Luteitalea sp.]
VVSQVVGVGIFLTPATMMRTLGSTGAALGIWAVMGALSIAGALCYAELTTRFPKAGGGYIFLRQAFGARSAFVFGWMALLVTDPGITAALGIGIAQYLLAALEASPTLVPVVAVAATIAFGLLALAGIAASATVLRWTAIAKLTIVAILVGAAALQAGSPAPVDTGAVSLGGAVGIEAFATSLIAAFFAFGGWWELGRMSEEVESPQRTMPRALIGGLVLVTAIYAAVSVAYALSAPARVGGTDEAFVAAVGAALFGDAAGRLLAMMVVVAVSGSLVATLLAAPRMYLAMSRDGLFPPRLVRFDERRGASPAATLIQVSLACLLIALGSFDQILGYFVPVTIFFLALSAAAVLRLPRPAADGSAFRVPLHPLPILLFLFLIASVLALFMIGQPIQTLLGAAVAAIGVPISFLVLPRRPRVVPAS